MDAGNKGLERISHRRIARKIVAVAALLVGQTLAWPVAYEYLVADRCTAAGGSFDYDVSRCDFQAHHAGIVLWQRHGLSLAVACVLGVTGCALLLGRPK